MVFTLCSPTTRTALQVSIASDLGLQQGQRDGSAYLPHSRSEERCRAYTTYADRDMTHGILQEHALS